MTAFVTQLEAKDVETGEFHIYAGPKIYAPTKELAIEYCKLHMPFLDVMGKLIMEGGFKKDGSIDWGNSVNYETSAQN